MRSSHLGIHQLALPRKCIIEGTRTVRRMKASSSTAPPEADAELGDDALTAEGEGEEDRDHDERGGGDDASGVGLSVHDRHLVVTRY